MADWDYDPAPEPRATARLRSRYGPVVDGRTVDGGGEPVTNPEPGSGEPLAEVGTASAADVDAAVAAARRDGWTALRGAVRARALFRLADAVRDRAAELAVLEALDTGAPVRLVRDADLPAAADALFSAAGWADKLEHAGAGPAPRPAGVVALVAPAEAPLLTTARALGPALAAGCPVVVAPSRGTPLAALVLAELAAEAGLPPGALQVLPGGADVGAALAGHAGVATVAVPAAVAATVRRAVAGTGRRVLAAPATTPVVVVQDDAPLDQAVDGVVALLARRGARLVVQEPVVDELLAAVRARAAALRVGDPLDRNTDVGALPTPARRQRVADLVDAATADGAEVWTAPQPLPDRGWYAAPVVLADVGPTMRAARGEVGGPVLPVLTFRTPDEAVATANGTGAAHAVVWSDKGSRALWTAQRLRAATVRVGSADPADPSPGVEAHLDA